MTQAQGSETATDTTFNGLIDFYYKNGGDHRQNAASKITCRKRAEIAQEFLGAISLSDLSVTEANALCERYMQQRLAHGAPEGTVLNELGVAHAIVKFCRKKAYITSNPLTPFVIALRNKCVSARKIAKAGKQQAASTEGKAQLTLVTDATAPAPAPASRPQPHAAPAVADDQQIAELTHIWQEIQAALVKIARLHEDARHIMVQAGVPIIGIVGTSKQAALPPVVPAAPAAPVAPTPEPVIKTVYVERPVAPVTLPALVEQTRTARGWNYTQLAKAANVKRKAVMAVCNGTDDADPSILLSIIVALGLHPWTEERLVVLRRLMGLPTAETT